MSSGLNTGEEREKERQQREGELLRQISTLNVATIVLLVTLSNDTLPTDNLWLSLLAFLFSLTVASAGLLFYVTSLSREAYREGRPRPSFAITSALLFLFGVVVLFFTYLSGQ